MNPVTLEATDYLTQQKNYFWRWADDGQVIEWQNGFTICYRGELLELFRHLEGQNIVPLSSILLFLAACNENYTNAGGNEVLHRLAEDLKFKNKAAREVLLKQALDFMNAVAGLPQEIKGSAGKKAHIINEVFQIQSNLSNLSWRLLADELNSGRVDISEEKGLVKFLPDEFDKELSYLSSAGLIYSTTEKLVVKILTGLPDIPKPAEISVPEPESDLLGQLAEDPKTAGISFLTKHLIAALNIPLQSQGSGEQPLGGISDITNKGNYDRLLLSELAQDEELLTARLVNNEALYFKREEPPDNVNRKRVLLLDTTLKMWGTPRAFGTSAALACSLNTRHGETIEAFALEEDYYTSINLVTKSGVMEGLQKLSPALHCGKALNVLIAEQAKTNSDEYIFITGDWQHQPYDFQLAFSIAKPALNFIISVARTGELHLYECINSNTKLLSTSKFDLDELLFNQSVKKRKPLRKEHDGTIEFLQQETSPLYFPTPQSIRLTNDNATYIYEHNVIAVTEDQRLLYWGNKKKGAVELLDSFELGTYYFGFNGETKASYFLLLPIEGANVVLYKINSGSLELEKTTFPGGISSPKKVVYENGKFNIESGNALIAIDCEKAEALPPVASKGYFKGYDARTEKLDKYAKRFINPGYNVLGRMEEMKISRSGKICFHGRELRHVSNKGLCIAEYTEGKEDYIFSEQANITHEIVCNPNIKFKKFSWPDGSEIITDSRGFLHLISSDAGMRQVTITFIINKGVACWASDGATCGSDYFIRDRENMEPEKIFYNTYIQPFIDRIIALCS